MTIEEFKRKHLGESVVYAEDLQPLLNISPDRIREYARTGDFPIKSIPSGNRTKFLKDDVIRYCEGSDGKRERHSMVELHFSGDSLKEVIGKIHEFLDTFSVE